MPTGDLYDYRLVHSMRYLKSPLFPVFRRLGATSFLWYNHILHAVDFEGQTKDQEYWAIRNGATLWDVGVERPVEIDGPEGFALMDLLTPRDYWWMEAEFPNHIPVIITRTGWTGEVGYEVFCLDNTRVEEMVTLILARGKPLGLIPAGPNHARRIEAGILNNQSDMDLTTNLYELGLEWQIEPKQRFIGKEALERIRRDGIKRRLVGFEVDGEPAQHEFEGPWVVYKDGKSVGRASAFVYSPTLKKNIGLAMIKIEYTAPGQRIEVQRLPGEPRHKAAVVTLPFIDPKKEIPKRRLDASTRS